LELTLGRIEPTVADTVKVAGAVADAEQSVTYADRSADGDMRMLMRTTHADALHQAGRRDEAYARFREAEQMQAEFPRQDPLLYSVQGFQYCELLLADAECAAWRRCLQRKTGNRELPAVLESCRAIEQRAAQTIKIAERNHWLLDIALDHLTLGRVALCRAIIEESEIRNPKSEIEEAMSGFRRAGQQDYLPRGLLTRAWLRFLLGSRTGPETAQTDLDEAWEIAERGPMRLHMADIHLYRARLFHGVTPYPWDKDEQGKPRGPKDDLAAARKLIEKCGYWRRKEELEDAEEAAKSW
jgi:tetratricopeptide (TPR) repeat protein